MEAGKRIWAVVVPAALAVFSASRASGHEPESVTLSASVDRSYDPTLPEAVLVIRNGSSRTIKVQDPGRLHADSYLVVHWHLPSGERTTEGHSNACQGFILGDEGPKTFSVSPGRSVEFTISLVNATCPNDGSYRQPLSPGRYTVILEYHWAKRRLWWSPLSFRVPEPRGKQ
jgi:hypothetical protein